MAAEPSPDLSDQTTDEKKSLTIEDRIPRLDLHITRIAGEDGITLFKDAADKEFEDCLEVLCELNEWASEGMGKVGLMALRTELENLRASNSKIHATILEAFIVRKKLRALYPEVIRMQKEMEEEKRISAAEEVNLKDTVYEPTLQAARLEMAAANEALAQKKSNVNSATKLQQMKRETTRLKKEAAYKIQRQKQEEKLAPLGRKIIEQAEYLEELEDQMREVDRELLEFEEKMNERRKSLSNIWKSSTET